MTTTTAPKQTTTGRISPAQARRLTGQNPQAAATTQHTLTAKTTIPTRQSPRSEISVKAGRSGEPPPAKGIRGISRGGGGAATSGEPRLATNLKSLQKLFSRVSNIERGPSSGAFSALGFQPSSFGGDGPFGFAGFNVGAGSFGGDFGSISDFGVGDVALLSAMKEGGFVRKKT